MALYTNSGMNESPYCSSCSLFSFRRSFSTVSVESMTRNSLINIIMASMTGVSLLNLCTAFLLT